MRCLAVIPDGMCDQPNWSACRPWDGDETPIVADLRVVGYRRIVVNRGMPDIVQTEQEVSEADDSNTLQEIDHDSPHCQQKTSTGVEYREVGLSCQRLIPPTMFMGEVLSERAGVNHPYGWVSKTTSDPGHRGLRGRGQCDYRH